MIVSVLLIAVLMIPLTGCSSLLETSQPNTATQPNTDVDNIQWDDMFERVCSCTGGFAEHFYIYREITTDVMYILLFNGQTSGLTVMLDTDGTALLYSKWVTMHADAPAATEPTAPETAVKDTCVSCGTQYDTAYCPNCGTKQ